MIIFATVYTGKKEIWQVDSELLKQLGNGNMFCYHKDKVGFYGNIYNLEQLFTSEDAARLDWDREPVKVTDRYNPFTGKAFTDITEYRNCINQWVKVW